MKKILKFLFTIPIIIGAIIGVIIAIKGNLPDDTEKKILSNIVSKLQTKEANLERLYIYGTSLNVEGTISGINKDNLEGAKLILTDGLEEKEYKLDTSIKENVLSFKSSQINNMIDLQKLEKENYYILIRLKLNNSANYKYYSINNSENKSLEYYPISLQEEKYKIFVGSIEKEFKKSKYTFLGIIKISGEAPNDAFDIVIDAGHGGKDPGEKYNGNTEADITLQYAEKLAEYLTQCGLKVKMTRTKENSDTYNYVNMYSANGRITTACESKAKYMISLHVNSNAKKISGFEIYAPCKSSLSFAERIADKIKEKTTIEASTNETYKMAEGVYVRNFTTKEIEQYKQTAEKKEYEPYPITLDTPYLYTIREVGGIATNAYVDGRNKDYSANKYYQSNYGIECYQIELRIF